MKCKLAVAGYDIGRYKRGDVVDATPVDVFMGEKVEPFGGPFRIIIIDDAGIDHAAIVKLTTPFRIQNPDYNALDENSPQHIFHPTLAREYNLSALSNNDAFLMELISEQRTTGLVQDIIDRTFRKQDA